MARRRRARPRGADLVSISAHKFGGPKGSGALVVRGDVQLQPLLEGGGQERGRRAGTVNVAGAAATAAAIAATTRDRARRRRARRARCATGCSRVSTRTVDGLFVNGDPARKVAGSCHVGVPGVEAEVLLVGLDRAGVCAAAGSSCSSGATEPSHVLAGDGALGCRGPMLDPLEPRLRVDRRRCRPCTRCSADGRRSAAESRMNVLVAMSGGVDSSVAAALLRAGGHDVTGVTLRLWGGETDSGCCSVSDVEDARRVAAQLDIPHYVFNLADDFEACRGRPVRRRARRRNDAEPVRRVQPVDQVRCAARPGPGAGVRRDRHRPPRARRARAGGVDSGCFVEPTAAKDQSYVLYMLGQSALRRTLLPIGQLTKAEVRAHAARLGLRTADKPESMDVCFVRREDRRRFVAERVGVRPRRRRRHRRERPGASRRHRGLHGRTAPRPRCRRRRAEVRRRRRRATATRSRSDSRRDLLCDHVDVRDLTWVDERPERRHAVLACRRVRTARRCRASSVRASCASPSRRDASRPGRSSRSTTATRCSAVASRPDAAALRRIGVRRRAARRAARAAADRQRRRASGRIVSARPRRPRSDHVDRAVERDLDGAERGPEAEVDRAGSGCGRWHRRRARRGGSCARRAPGPRASSGRRRPPPPARDEPPARQGVERPDREPGERKADERDEPPHQALVGEQQRSGHDPGHGNRARAGSARGRAPGGARSGLRRSSP